MDVITQRQPILVSIGHTVTDDSNGKYGAAKLVSDPTE